LKEKMEKQKADLANALNKNNKQKKDEL